MKFTCATCNYSTDTKFCYQKHLTTKKHNENVTSIKIEVVEARLKPGCIQVENIQKGYQCPYCDKNYATAGNLSRHKRVCNEKNDQDKKQKQILEQLEIKYKHEIELLNTQVQKFSTLYEQEKQSKHNLEKDNKYLKTLVNNAGIVIKSSVSTMSYLMTNYTDAPVLKPITDFSAIEYDEEDEDFNLMDALIVEHDNGNLHKYLGEFIIKTYKKEDPSQQSIWNSDSVRLTYVIREIINKNPEWKTDKKGVSAKKYIIDPLLKYINKIVGEYICENADLSSHTHEPKWKLKIISDKLNSAAKIRYNINNKFLAEDVLKYIAPHFYLNKTDQLIKS
ncbi:zinc finger protein [Klosneuvirus KNV1]|uniref:Zinc finger protein n=1 Tax=Klosneuvirus KNV1 TaxID=1977640 RepID=A0A1V0SI32_9VIRU|nr:zinc finger protein [Klosneuvirus KNV1]